jgi:hypothetical protein
MQLPRLKVLTIAVPVFFVMVAEVLRLQYLSAKLPQVAISSITVALTLLGAYLFSGVIFRMVEKSQAAALEQEDRLLVETRERQRQAEKLYRIGLELAGFLELDKKIHEVMEQTRQLFNADLAEPSSISTFGSSRDKALPDESSRLVVLSRVRTSPNRFRRCPNRTRSWPPKAFSQPWEPP